MCTRYYIDSSFSVLSKIIKEAKESLIADLFDKKTGKPIIESGEVHPTDIVPVIAPSRSGKKTVFPMRWGYKSPLSTKPLLNARVETAGSKPTFRDSWKHRRCIIPASHYFEWSHFKTPEGKTKTGDKYAIQPADSDITWLCGLYRMEDDLPVFVVLTREPPGGDLSAIHDRMPLMFSEGYIDQWISPMTDPDHMLTSALTDMYIEKVK